MKIARRSAARTLVAAAVVAGLTAFTSPALAAPSPSVNAPPEAVAAAAATPKFEIFYSPGCANASRIYSGQNFGEWWVNDTFNRNAWGSAGYGQKIRNNAASVRITNATLYIATSADMEVGTVSFYKGAASGCYNLEPYGVRNQNVWWATMYYVP
ncbi:hypothetical protein ACIBJE_25330 [Micromonospora sp. NPDC050187]|uniref:hypothetical protein n=1 Tax=Micromonospora sp. NPDC050187 TaxID=3364277 RepID=UPI0037900C99